MSRVARPRPRRPGSTHRLCSSQQSPQDHPLMPATTLPAWRTKIARSTSSPSPIAADASRRICVSRTSISAGSGWSSTRNSTEAGSSGTDDLLDQRKVVEVGPEGPDLPLAEIGHGDAGQLDVPSRCFQHAIRAQHERPGVIGFDEPFGERLVAHFVESPERDHDVGERFFTEGGEVSECCQPGHGGVRRPADDVVGEQGLQVNRCVTGLGPERVRQHLFARSTHFSPYSCRVPSESICSNICWPSGVQEPSIFALAAVNSSSDSAPEACNCARCSISSAGSAGGGAYCAWSWPSSAGG